MWGDLQAQIGREALKHIRRYEQQCRRAAEENGQRQRRSIVAVQKVPTGRPAYWALDKGFDPYWVRANSDRVAHSIGGKLRAGAYEPFAPAAYSVPKMGGGQREVAVFQIGDAVVSRMLFSSMMTKNLGRISARAYAYRRDVGAFDSLQYLQAEFRRSARLFVAEYDFSKFFDNISHGHIWDVLESEKYLMTPLERNLIRGFLEHRILDPGGAYGRTPSTRRELGVPQGSSISLFLANVAASPLDRSLERIGVGFTRYADDTIIFDPDYSRVSRAVDQLYSISSAMGVPVNHQKSRGIRLLTKHADAPVEMPGTSSLDYLGHAVSVDHLAMRSEVVTRVKSRVRRLIYDNLLRESLEGTQDPSRLTSVDRDFVALVWQLRRYMYGNLSEREVRRYLTGSAPNRRFIGLMSFFPLIDDAAQLAELDRWVAREVWLAMKKRARLLGGAGISVPSPHGLPLDKLVSFRHTSATTGDTVDCRLPRFSLISGLIRAAAEAHGPSVVGRSGAGAYRYSN